jgi:hypothetical protein
VKEGVAAPKVLPAEAWGEPRAGLKAGDPCTENGRQGVLRERNGYLYCETRTPEPTRADAMPPRTMTADQAQAIKDRAWREMVDDISNAWRQSGTAGVVYK